MDLVCLKRKGGFGAVQSTVWEDPIAYFGPDVNAGQVINPAETEILVLLP